MTKLRDINLRWSDDSTAPEWFWKRGILEYMLFQEIRKLKIETPNFTKINVYYEPEPTSYAGYVFDGVTDVQVFEKCDDIDSLSPQQLNERFLNILIQGIKIVFDWFKISTECLNLLVNKLQSNNFTFSYVLSTVAAYSKNQTYSARLYLESELNLESCVIVVAIFKGRKRIGTLPICTTFPMPDYAIEQFKSLEWSNESQIISTFNIYGKPNNKTVFCRYMFDCRGYSTTTYFFNNEESRITLETDVSSILDK